MGESGKENGREGRMRKKNRRVARSHLYRAGSGQAGGGWRARTV